MLVGTGWWRWAMRWSCLDNIRSDDAAEESSSLLDDTFPITAVIYPIPSFSVNCSICTLDRPRYLHQHGYELQTALKSTLLISSVFFALLAASVIDDILFLSLVIVVIEK